MLRPRIFEKFSCAFLCALLALAQGARADELDLSQASESLWISKENCRLLARHRPAPGVAYEPGVDAHGRPVPPADLGSPSLPPLIFIRVEADPPASGAGWTTEIPVLTLALDLGTGALTTMDGRPVSGLGESDYLAACRRQSGAGE